MVSVLSRSENESSAGSDPGAGPRSDASQAELRSLALKPPTPCPKREKNERPRKVLLRARVTRQAVGWDWGKTEELRTRRERVKLLQNR